MEAAPKFACRFTEWTAFTGATLFFGFVKFFK